MSDKVECPLCGKKLELIPHPDKPDRLIALCSCQGAEVAVVETNKSAPTPHIRSKGE